MRASRQVRPPISSEAVSAAPAEATVEAEWQQERTRVFVTFCRASLPPYGAKIVGRGSYRAAVIDKIQARSCAGILLQE
jgi:hypothetical protein